MSKIVVDFEDKSNSIGEAVVPPEFGDYQEPKKRSLLAKILGVTAGLVVIALLFCAIGGFFYWRYLQTTPQYSIALLVDAAKRDDQKLIDELIDTDVVIDDFVPQIVDKAIELYGRGLAPKILQRVTRIATPFLPVVKKRARAELPGLIREKTEKFAKVPFWAIALGAGKYLNFEYKGDRVVVTSKVPEQSVNFTMKRNGDKWQIIALKDERLAKQIARKIGQEMIGLAKNRGRDTIDRLGKRVGIPNLGDIIDQTQEVFK